MNSYHSYAGSGYKAQQVANLYKSNSNEGLSQRELMAKLHQKIINQLYLARDAYAAGNVEGMLEHNLKVIHIADVLRQEMAATSALMTDDPEGAIAVRHHANLYLQILERTTNVLQKKPPEEEFNSIIEFIKPLYEAWLPPKPESATQASLDASEAPNTNVAS